MPKGQTRGQFEMGSTDHSHTVHLHTMHPSVPDTFLLTSHVAMSEKY